MSSAHTEKTKPVPAEEPRWHASIAVVLALALYVTLPPRLEFGPVWIFPVLVLGVLIPLLVLSPTRKLSGKVRRIMSTVMIALVNLFNVFSVVRLVFEMLGTHPAGFVAATGSQLLVAGGEIWATNILVYALWYWELDAGGPEARSHFASAMDFPSADFLYPQMLVGDRLKCIDTRSWRPMFFDYVYLAFSTSLAFSAADVMPLSKTAKFLMLAEAGTSFVTIAVILARAVGMT